MSEASQSTIVPEWTIGDRMGKALAVAGISVGEISDYLGLSRNSVSAYINDRHAPKRQTLMLWAMRTGVSLDWLETGVSSDSPTPPPSGKRDNSALAALIAEKSGRAATDRYSTFQPGFGTAA